MVVELLQEPAPLLEVGERAVVASLPAFDVRERDEQPEAEVGLDGEAGTDLGEHLPDERPRLVGVVELVLGVGEPVRGIGGVLATPEANERLHRGCRVTDGVARPLHAAQRLGAAAEHEGALHLGERRLQEGGVGVRGRHEVAAREVKIGRHARPLRSLVAEEGVGWGSRAVSRGR